MGVEAVLERRRKERSTLLARVGEWVEELRAGIGLEGVAVFGSVARGDFNQWSDIDVLIVAEGIGGDPLARAERLGARPPRVQPVIWTPAEARSELARGNPVAVEAVGTGVWIVGSAELLQPAVQPDGT